ncbi:MAG TPA: serine hydrolase domain-containing protein [Hyphomonadaceae bacterium]|jgi:CubicO group peptidase (beta-lactamase class C family)|nr:serine hydrolase domain-containing protein [Hyphomonadaceae bacterium]
MTDMTRRTLLAAAAATASACATAPAALLQPAASPAGFSAEGLARIRPALQSAVDAGNVPGMVTMLWRRGELAQVNAIGVRDIAGNLPMERTTIFRLASMTKPVTVAAALRLMEQGKLRLEDPIARWAPEFANMRVLKNASGALDDTYLAPRAITIEDLMTHTSGITSYGFISSGPLAEAVTAKFGGGVESDLSPDQWMAALGALPLAYAPGERFNYGHGIDVLGFILARIEKAPLRDVMHEQLFAPLKMVDTDFWIPPAKRSRAASLYMSGAPKSFEPLTMPGFVGPRPPAYTSGGQGLVSSADDYLTFARMLMGGGEVDGKRLLKRETVRLMTANRLTPAQKVFSPIMSIIVNWKAQGFGLGVSVVEDAKAYEASPMGPGASGAFSWNGAFGGNWQADPAEDLIYIWLQQASPAPPKPGVFPYFPGGAGFSQFRKLAYAARTA